MDMIEIIGHWEQIQPPAPLPPGTLEVRTDTSSPLITGLGPLATSPILWLIRCFPKAASLTYKRYLYNSHHLRTSSHFMSFVPEAG